ncbi:MAG: AsmA family protein, partial [Acidobacteriaceae bacterium]|nr:AsmA family protein [Acidobacteriaceae bacterium]
PFINLSRFRHSIATSIGESIGRPVHLDNVNLNLFPWPGFTLTNFVVSEDPEFGYEPIIRANEVRATLRISSLWRGRVEFSTISFKDPSMNLVRLPDGRWNIESLLLHASRIEAAPTAQKKAGRTPRFPYIEATGARLNLKQGDEKMPFSLTDADFALWLPDPERWRLRLEGHPARTDIYVQYTGVMRFEATLNRAGGRATSLADFPIEVDGSWRNAPLGEASHVVLGHDAGWRGKLTLETKIRGRVGTNTVQTRLRINDVRREEFIPEQPLTVDLSCNGEAAEFFRSFSHIRCVCPSEGNKPAVVLGVTVLDVRQWRDATVEAVVADVPASRLIDWWHIVSPRVPEGLAAEGMLTGNLSYYHGANLMIFPKGRWDGSVTLAGARLKTSGKKGVSLLDNDPVLHTISPLEQDKRRGRNRKPQPPADDSMHLDPVRLNLGGHDPAILTGQIDNAGSTFHLVGMATQARLDALAKAIPQLGDGLDAVLPRTTSAEPFRIDLTATRLWGAQQQWHDNLAHPASSAHRHHR